MSVPVRFSQRVERSGAPLISYLMEQAVANPDLISLAAGLVDTESLPDDEVLAAANRILSDPKRGKSALQYGTTSGDATLRQLLAERLDRMDQEAGKPGTPIDPDQVVIGTGSQQLLYLVSEVLLDPGDIVLLGVPAYFVYMGALESFGVNLIGVESDENGVIPEAIDEELAKLERSGELDRVKLIYEPSYFNNPTGWTLSAERRPQLVEIAQRWSKRRRILILEDAAYRELRYSGRDIPSLRAFDETGDTVLYAGTFSKPFSPGLKSGYLVAPHDLIEPLIHQKGHHDFGSSNLIQQILAECMRTGGYDRQLTRIRSLYQSKLKLTLDLLHDGLEPVSPQVIWTQPEGGLYVWLELPKGIATDRDSRFFKRCLEAGVLYVPGEFCYPRSSHGSNHSLRLSFGVPTPEKIREGIRRLCSVVLTESAVQ